LATVTLVLTLFVGHYACNKFCFSGFPEKLIRHNPKEVVAAAASAVEWQLEQCGRVGDVCGVSGFVPSVAVGVVGIGHVPGIVANWNQPQDIQQLLQ